MNVQNVKFHLNPALVGHPHLGMNANSFVCVTPQNNVIGNVVCYPGLWAPGATHKAMKLLLVLTF